MDTVTTILHVADKQTTCRLRFIKQCSRQAGSPVFHPLRKVMLIITLPLLLTLDLFSQTRVDSLFITDCSTRNPIPNVHIYLNDSLIGITNTNGVYHLKAPLHKTDHLSDCQQLMDVILLKKIRLRVKTMLCV